MRDSGTHPLHAVHPHVCGEYASDRLQIKRIAGSSPRVWGILSGTGAEEASKRFIPTCVGNTFRGFNFYDFHTVHPHVCGEYEIRSHLDTHYLRFIPTCVGNT